MIDDVKLAADAPVVGIPCDLKEIDGLPFHAVGEKYVTAVMIGAQAMPWLVPAFGPQFDMPALLDRLDGLEAAVARGEDVTAELTKIKELNPEVIYFGGLTPLGVRVLKQMDQLGIKAQFQGTSGMVGPSFVDGVGPKLGEGVIAMYDMKPVEELPGGKFFMEEYAKAKYNEPFAAYGPYAYSAATLVMDTIEKTGPNRDKISTALRETKDYQAIVGKITFDDHGQNTNPTTTKYIVQDGKFIDWDKSEYATGKRKLKGH